MGYVREPRLQMVAFVMIASMIAFYFYLGRVLRQLDPSRAIPGRVRAALDTLAEGLLVVDPKGYIVLANQAFSRVVGQSAEALIGKQASAFAWTGADGTRLTAAACPVERDAARRHAAAQRLRASGGQRRQGALVPGQLLGGPGRGQEAAGRADQLRGHHRAAGEGGRAAPGQGGRRGGQPRQERLPGQHEP